MGIWRKRFICNNHRGMSQMEGEFGMQIEEELVWPKEISKAMVFEI
jgi:hypothetical protein